MKNLLKTFVIGVALMLVSVTTGWAQANLTRTTLSAAVSSTNQALISVSSTAGMTLPSTASNQYFLLIDNELMSIQPGSGIVSPLRVTRGVAGVTTKHLSGATVIFGKIGRWDSQGGGSSGSVLMNTTFPRGTCTRSSNETLPIIVSETGSREIGLATCNGGFWQRATLPDEVIGQGSPQRVCNIQNSGIAALTSLGVSTTGGAGTVYVSSIFVPYTKFVTGVSVLNGATVGTSLTLVALYDAAGNLIANSATGGISGGTASTFWDISFATAILIAGPAKYHIGVQNTGATATFQLLGAGAAFGDVLGNARAGTMGTLPSITVPTAFTSVQVPIGCLF